MSGPQRLARPIENNYQFAKKVIEARQDLSAKSIDTLQINLTKLCNQACLHCHVDSSPRRKEAMSDKVIEKIIDILATEAEIKNLDITGGAPELHPMFKDLVTHARRLGKNVMVRHNLTVVQDPHPVTKESMEYLPDFFAETRVEIISSLPYYQEFFTDKQRGSGVFEKSITTLRQLNERGFGIEDSGRILNLVYNPVGAFLPPPQESLEASYKQHLKDKFDIQFNQLFAITNMPIHRFKAQLKKLDTLDDYMQKLVNSFNPVAASGIMCRSLVSVDYNGNLFDCDFNQVLNLDIQGPKTIFDWDTAKLKKRVIKTADHCFGCTAGAGSSCGGNTANE